MCQGTLQQKFPNSLPHRLWIEVQLVNPVLTPPMAYSLHAQDGATPLRHDDIIAWDKHLPHPHPHLIV
jgi:hypothetical protein